MRADRILIAAVLVLATGVWTLLNFSHGNSGIAFAIPVSGSKVNIDLTTMGPPVLFGVPLTIIGVVLLVVAFFAALVEQFRRPHVVVRTHGPAAATTPPFDSVRDERVKNDPLK